MERYNGIPIFEVIFSDEESLFNNVAIVTEPAIEENFIRLSKEEDTVIKMKVDDEKRVVTGAVLIPDHLILRKQNGRTFYIKYSAKTIEQMAINFFKNHRNTEGNVEHEIPVNGIVYYESYIMNKDRGIQPKEFAELPSGTWIMSAKIYNDDVWNGIVNGVFNGYSIDISKVKLKEEDKPLEKIEELIEILKRGQ